MRRRLAVVRKSRVPKLLRQFIPSQWPGRTEWRQYEAWAAAVEERIEQFPGDAELIETPRDVAWNPEVDPP